MNSSDIKHRFCVSMMGEGDVRRLHDLMDCFRTLAHKINESMPESREKTVAMERLEESAMWCKAAIASYITDEENEEVVYEYTEFTDKFDIGDYTDDFFEFKLEP